MFSFKISESKGNNGKKIRPKQTMAKFLYFFFRLQLIVDAFANKRRRRVERTATLGTDTSSSSTLHSRRFACVGEILRRKKGSFIFILFGTSNARSKHHRESFGRRKNTGERERNFSCYFCHSLVFIIIICILFVRCALGGHITRELSRERSNDIHREIVS